MYRDDAAYLREWVEFHRLVGVERFYLYDNESRDQHREVLEPYIESGLVELTGWPVPVVGGTGRPSGIMRAFDDCIERHRRDSRWIAFLDIDEFLFTPTDTALPELLSEYEQWPGVFASRAEYGTSGHVSKPAGLTIESYVHRRRQIPDSRSYAKSIVDPARVARCASVHHFAYLDGLPVNENRVPVRMAIRAERLPISYSRLRINHYGLKSEEELRRKRALWDESGVERAQPPAIRVQVSSLYEEDHMMDRFVPALRRAMGMDERPQQVSAGE
jgi:hypothetical protein